MSQLLTDGAASTLSVAFKVLWAIARFALWAYVFYLTFFKADPTMRDLMLVSGIACLEILGVTNAVQKK